MRNILLILFFATTFSLTAFSEVECTDLPECWPDGSAMHRGLQLVKKQEAIKVQLGEKHKELLEIVSSTSTRYGDERLLTAIKTQQEAWAKYKDEECELIGSLTGAGGTWPSTYANQCSVNHIELRLRRLRSAIRCIKKIPIEERSYEKNRCLQQLAPLTNNKM